MNDLVYFYSLDHCMFPKVKNNLSNLFFNLTAVFLNGLTSVLQIT